MRSLLPILAAASLAVGAARLWLTYRRAPAKVESRRARIVRLTLDTYLVIVAVVVGVLLVALAVDVAINIFSNV